MVETFYYDEGTVYFFYQVKGNSEKSAKRKLRKYDTKYNDNSYDMMSLKVLQNVNFKILFDYLDIDESDEEDLQSEIHMSYKFFNENELEEMEEFIRILRSK